MDSLPIDQLRKLDGEFSNHRRINKDVVDQKYTLEFGNRYIEYRELWRNSGPESIPEFPIHLDVEVVDACNYRCAYCWRHESSTFVKKGDINTGKRFDLGKYREIIEEASRSRRRLYSVNLGFSGECTINKELPQFVKIARDHGLIDVRIITNGSLLTEKLVYELYESGITFISVSFDSNSEETYEKLRDKGGFEKVKTNLIMLYRIREKLGLNLPVIRASLFRAKENMHERDDFIESFRPFTDFIDIQPFTSDKPNHEFEIDPECMHPFRRLALFADGKVAPCCKFFSKQVIVGNYFEESLKEIWDGAKINRIRLPFKKKDVNLMSSVCVNCLKSVNV